MIEGKQPSPQRQRVIDFVTPLKVDVLFYETVDAQRVGVSIPTYGSPHPDTRNWPNHKLIFVDQPNDDSQLYRYFYAADRALQDSYNYELTTGERLVRTYIIPREDYPGSFVAPAGGTADSTFPAYGFVAESLGDAGQPLNGHYVVVQRVYTPINVYEFPYRPSIDGNVKVTRTLKPAGYELGDEELESVPGTVYEVAYGNEFHSVLVKTEEGVRATTLDAFNYKLMEGEALERYYIIERGDYPESFPVPEGGAPDAVFTDYGFVSDSIIPIEGEIQGGLVRLVRRYGRISVSSYPYDRELERNITVTETLIDIDDTFETLELASGNGVTYEIKPGNEFHQVLTTVDAGIASEAFPLSLPEIYSTVDRYPFPPKLTGVTFYYAAAQTWEVTYNAGEEPRSSKSEDSQPIWTLVEPERGPYKTLIDRRVCRVEDLSGTIDAIKGEYSILPDTKRETIIQGYSAYRAVSHWTQAYLREYVVPESYHLGLAINVVGQPPADASLDGESRAFFPSSLPITTNFSGDLSGEYLIDISVTDTTAELKMVTATVLVLAGIY